jgi:DNA-binding IclR family transcriptional regulator
MGAANTASGLTHGLPVGASSSRTAMNDAMGAYTQIAGIVSAAAVAMVLIFLTDPIASLPQAVLGAAIVAAAIGLIEPDAWRALWATDRVEFTIAGVTGAGVIVVGVLEAVATTDGGVGVRSLARETGIDRSAVSRLLLQLSELGIAAPAENGRYGIGPRLFAIAGAVTSRDELRRAARPSLEALAERFNETSYLAVLEDWQVVYRDVIESTQPLRYVGELGVPAPLHAGAAGRAILAGLDDDAFERWLASARLTAVTQATETDPARLRERRAAEGRQDETVLAAVDTRGKADRCPPGGRQVEAGCHSGSLSCLRARSSQRAVSS